MSTTKPRFAQPFRQIADIVGLPALISHLQEAGLSPAGINIVADLCGYFYCHRHGRHLEALEFLAVVRNDLMRRDSHLLDEFRLRRAQHWVETMKHDMKMLMAAE